MRYILLLCLLLVPCANASPLSRPPSAATPLKRIVSLAPHLTDMLIGLGARAQIAGVVDDHEIRGAHTISLTGLPVVADAFGLNEERLLSIKPDLVVIWDEGTSVARRERLQRLGIPVVTFRTSRLEDLAGQLEQLGRLTGHEAAGRQQATAFRSRLDALSRQYHKGPRLRYFYQVWRQPLYSLQGQHLVSQALARCGADNILPPGPVAAPLVDPEFVVTSSPDVIFFGKDDASASLAYWGRFTSLSAVKARQLLAVDDQRLARPGPELLDAIEPLCAQLQPLRRSAKQR